MVEVIPVHVDVDSGVGYVELYIVGMVNDCSCCSCGCNIHR